MKVKELIANLQGVDQELDVLVYDSDFCVYGHIYSCKVRTFPGQVLGDRLDDGPLPAKFVDIGISNCE